MPDPGLAALPFAADVTVTVTANGYTIPFTPGLTCVINDPKLLIGGLGERTMMHQPVCSRSSSGTGARKKVIDTSTSIMRAPAAAQGFGPRRTDSATAVHRAPGAVQARVAPDRGITRGDNNARKNRKRQ